MEIVNLYSEYLLQLNEINKLYKNLDKKQNYIKELDYIKKSINRCGISVQFINYINTITNNKFTQSNIKNEFNTYYGLEKVNIKEFLINIFKKIKRFIIKFINYIKKLTEIDGKKLIYEIKNLSKNNKVIEAKESMDEVDPYDFSNMRDIRKDIRKRLIELSKQYMSPKFVSEVRMLFADASKHSSLKYRSIEAAKQKYNEYIINPYNLLLENFSKVLNDKNSQFISTSNFRYFSVTVDTEKEYNYNIYDLLNDSDVFNKIINNIDIINKVDEINDLLSILTKRLLEDYSDELNKYHLELSKQTRIFIHNCVEYIRIKNRVQVVYKNVSKEIQKYK